MRALINLAPGSKIESVLADSENLAKIIVNEGGTVYTMPVMYADVPVLDEWEEKACINSEDLDDADVAGI